MIEKRTLPRNSRSQLAMTLANERFQDGAFAGAIVFSRLGQSFGAIGALLCLLLTGTYAVLRFKQVRDVIGLCGLHLVYPVIGVLSVLWAAYPAVTLRAAVQMAATAFAGLILSQSPHPRAVLIGMFSAYSGYTLLTLHFGQVLPDGLSGAMALYGFGGEAKNYFSDTASTATLLAITMTVLCCERHLWWRALLFLGGVVVGLLATVKAHSAGGIASLSFALALLCFLLLLRKRSASIKLLSALSLVSGLLMIAVFFEPLLEWVQEFSGKDSGLTGRGYLWFRADAIIAQKPWLGVGYYGFWNPLNPDAIGFWRFFDLRQEGTGFSFHNSYIQTVVELGYVGLVVLLLSWIGGALALLRRFVMTHSLPVCFWISYFALQMSKSGVEPVSPGTFVAPTIMLFTALGFSCLPLATKYPQMRKRRLSRPAAFADQVSG